jgi:hypothetical protein
MRFAPLDLTKNRKLRVKSFKVSWMDCSWEAFISMYSSSVASRSWSPCSFPKLEARPDIEVDG